MSTPLATQTIEQLKPFPLQEHLRVLPQSVLEEFSQLYDLVEGYVKSLSTYKDHEVEVVKELNAQIEKLNVCSELLENYNRVGDKIQQQVRELNGIFEEWTTLETIQYQLLSANFNQDALKLKFKRMLAESELALTESIKKFKTSEQSETDFTELVSRFRAERKLYHIRKEKFNRWNEERVSGFV